MAEFYVICNKLLLAFEKNAPRHRATATQALKLACPSDDGTPFLLTHRSAAADVVKLFLPAEPAYTPSQPDATDDAAPAPALPNRVDDILCALADTLRSVPNEKLKRSAIDECVRLSFEFSLQGSLTVIETHDGTIGVTSQGKPKKKSVEATLVAALDP